MEERLRQQRQVLADLLSQDLRKQLPNDNQVSIQIRINLINTYSFLQGFRSMAFIISSIIGIK